MGSIAVLIFLLLFGCSRGHSSDQRDEKVFAEPSSQGGHSINNEKANAATEASPTEIQSADKHSDGSHKHEPREDSPKEPSKNEPVQPDKPKANLVPPKEVSAEGRHVKNNVRPNLRKVDDAYDPLQGATSKPGSDKHIAQPKEQAKNLVTESEKVQGQEDIASDAKPCLPSEAPPLDTTSKDTNKIIPDASQQQETIVMATDKNEAPLSDKLTPTGNEDGGDGVEAEKENLQSQGKQIATEDLVAASQDSELPSTQPDDNMQPSVPRAIETPTPPPPAASQADEQLAAQAPAEEAEKLGEDATKPPEVVEEAKKEDEIPSFDEWKQKMLAEQEEQERNKMMEALSSQTNGQTVGKIKSNKKSANFASVTCGAKVLNTNPETQNPSFILTENKDQYMINPCKARKWFVVELCEPVQVHSLEMGNLELFSSLPASFTAQISERYPTKDWTSIGTFHARDERTVQSFPIGDEQLFTKYIRIEIKSHYGTEHYCPLSILRVFGMTVEEDESEDPDHTHVVDHADPIDDAEVHTEGDDTPPNLFESAKDTVLSIVKTVLNPSDKEKETTDGDIPEEVQQLNADPKANSSVKNATQAQNEKDASKETMLPCPPDAIIDGDGPANYEGKPSTQPEPPSPEISSQPPPGPAIAPPTTTSPPIVTLIETPSKRLSETINSCTFCLEQDRNECWFDICTTCGYYRLLHYVYPTCCVMIRPVQGPLQPNVSDETTVQTPSVVGKAESLGIQNTEDTKANTEEKKSEDTKDEEKTPVDGVKASNVDYIVKDIPEPTRVHKKSETSTQGQRSERQNSSELGGAVVEDTIKPSQTITSSENGQTLKTTEPLPSASINPDPNLEQQKVCNGPGAPGTSEPGCQLGPDPVQIRPTATNDSPQSKVVDTLETLDEVRKDPPVQDADEPKEPAKLMEPESEPQNTAQDKAELNDNGVKNIYASDPTGADSDLEHVSPPVGDDITFSKISSNMRKETTYMKLKNKIKNLELNLNLSSRYLEELSQRYKKKMEDMYVSLNKTIAKLADTSKSAEERDLKQQERIAHLEKQVEDISSVYSRVKDDIDSIHSQVIERHLFLMLLEAVIFTCMLAWCLSRQQNIDWAIQRQQQPNSTRTLPKSVKEKQAETKRSRYDSLSRSDDEKPKRRNSIESTPRRDVSPSLVPTPERKSYDDTDLRKGGDYDLTIIEPNIPIFITDIAPRRSQYVSNAQKKKKKKREKQQKAGNPQCPHNMSSHNNSGKTAIDAGVIFGVQDVPMTSSLRRNQSSTHSSSSSISNTSCSQVSSRDPPAHGAKPVQHSKLAARKSLDSAFSSSVKSHKHSRSNGSTPSYVNVNGHSDLSEPGDRGSAYVRKMHGVNGTAGQSANGGVNAFRKSTSTSSLGWGIKGWFSSQDGDKNGSTRE